MLKSTLNFLLKIIQFSIKISKWRLDQKHFFYRYMLHFAGNVAYSILFLEYIQLNKSQSEN